MLDNAEIAKLEVSSNDVVLVRVASLTPELGKLISQTMAALQITRFVILDDRVDISTINKDDWKQYTKKFFPDLLK